jgi:catechol 2,3-dioxygenase-like lactoylglutathione lyase family enzyme
MTKIISGIQQMGIGVPDVEGVFRFYRKFISNDVKIFEEAAEAHLMTEYTGNRVHSRTATMAVNLNGGGGFEIWQYTSREPQRPVFNPLLGDTGIFVTRIKSRDVESTHSFYRKEGVQVLGELSTAPNGRPHFFFTDPNDNIFEIVEGDEWFGKTSSLCGGVAGAMLGSSDIDRARRLYGDVLGYDTVEYDETGVFDDLKALPGGDQRIRRVLLSHSQPRRGPFSRFLGPSHLELVQTLVRKPRKIFENRYWGDWGFIHLCFDVKNMAALRADSEKAGFPFTVDSGKTFDMGEAGGQFAYVEDPDGTLIEFVETHKIPILKKLGWYLDLKKRPAEKPLPDWILKALRFNRVKD